MTQRPENPGSDSFVHLYVHSEFSLLDGLSRIPEMTQRAADQGMPALALTDPKWGQIRVSYPLALPPPRTSTGRTQLR